MTKKNEVAKKGEDQLPAEFMDELLADGDQYKETMGKDDMSIAFKVILQSLSPQCTKGEPEFIKGAEPSDIFDTVTGTLIKTRDDDDNEIEGFRVMPVHYKRSFIEWVPRSAGGGIVQEYSVEDGLSIVTARNDQNQDIIQPGSPIGKPGNQLNDTHTHIMMAFNDDGAYEPIVMTMTSTQIKPSKDLNNMVSKHHLANGTPMSQRFFGVYGVTTKRRSNDQGSWYVWNFTKVDDVEANPSLMPAYRASKEFLAGVLAGEHKVDHSKAEGEVNPSTGGEASPGAGGGASDEEVPF